MGSDSIEIVQWSLTPLTVCFPSRTRGRAWSFAETLNGAPRCVQVVTCMPPAPRLDSAARISRQKLLDAAARIYGEYGFRGATTRRIAEEAGVNEVTLFRLFGSKSQLLAEAIRHHAPQADVHSTLPETPIDPSREVAEWCEQELTHMRDCRSLIRKAMGELEEHPELVPSMSKGPTSAYTQLVEYASRLPRSGPPLTERETAAAATMLFGALFADVMGRDIMPDLYPQPAESAASLYAKMFLRALGASPAPSRERARSPASSRRRARSSQSTT